MLFTPISARTGKRIRLQIKETFIPRGCYWRKKVTDLKTGKTYLARGAACELPGCICDAVIYGYQRNGGYQA